MKTTINTQEHTISLNERAYFNSLAYEKEHYLTIKPHQINNRKKAFKKYNLIASFILIGAYPVFVAFLLNKVVDFIKIKKTIKIKKFWRKLK